MRYAVNSEQMKQIDNYTVDQVQIPQLVLMERAAVEIVAIMKNKITKQDRILVVCGPGNNGGDGVAAGRILFLQGYHVAILFMGEEERLSSGMIAQMEIAKNLGIPRDNNNKLHEYNIIIDAVFGVGLSREVTGPYEAVFKAINQNKNYVYSVDIPSGISSDTGKVCNVAVKADETITFGYLKLGLMFYPGVTYGGKVTVADIGFPEIATEQVSLDTFYYESEDLKRLPERIAYSNKGTYGKALVIAGSRGMSGAAYLSAKACFRGGAGLVKILTHPDNRIILQSLLPEALFASYLKEDSETGQQSKELEDSLQWSTVTVIGPGLGRSEEMGELLKRVFNKCTGQIILDADAINLLALELDHVGLNEPKERIKSLSDKLPAGTILTPHLKELARLIGLPIESIRDNFIDIARQCSYNNKLIYVLKDARTIVSHDSHIFINTTGNNGMATGGSGDVLTGIIAALVAQGLEPYTSACLAVYIHGWAGDLAMERKGTYSLMAGDIIDELENVLKERIS